MSRLEAQGVATRQGTHAAALQGFYREKYNLSPEQFPNAYLADRLSLALPLYPQMTDEDQDFVSNSCGCIGHCSKSLAPLSRKDHSRWKSQKNQTALWLKGYCKASMADVTR